jgi:hypothetical protein
MDASQALADAENSLRDFIASVLVEMFGSDWLETCGVTPERIAKWRERKVVEEKKQVAGVVEERLIYYADFYDLRSILKTHWNGPFSEALGEYKVFDVLLGQLENLRDPVAHRRELLPHQKSLAIGISGEIRGRIVRYRGKRDTVDDAFPRIESARDSLGNIVTAPIPLNTVITGMVLRPNDQIDYVVTASDPEDLPLEYGINVPGQEEQWQKENTFSIRIDESHIRKTFVIELMIRSPRSYHARGKIDDKAEFYYSVIPRKVG